MTQFNFSSARRNFLKLNMAFLLSPLLGKVSNDTFHLEQNPFALLDRIALIDFSSDIKDEILLRVSLQKKYGYDCNGKIMPFDRFLKENANYILYKGDLNDIFLYAVTIKSHLDYITERSAYHNRIETIECFSHELVGNQNRIYEKALLACLSNKSINTVCHILQSPFSMNDECYDEVKTILTSIRYRNELEKIQHHLPPFNIDYLAQTSSSPSFASFNPEYYNIWLIDEEGIISLLEEFLEGLNHVMQKMQYTGIIKDFSLNMHQQKIRVQIFNETYPITFISDVDTLLRTMLPEIIHLLMDQMDVLILECE